MRYDDYYMMGEPAGEGYFASGMKYEEYSAEGNTYESNMYETAFYWYNAKRNAMLNLKPLPGHFEQRNELLQLTIWGGYIVPAERKYHNLLTAKNLFPSEVKNGVLTIVLAGYMEGMKLYEKKQKPLGKLTASYVQDLIDEFKTMQDEIYKTMNEAAEKEWQEILKRKGVTGMAIYKVEQEAKDKAKKQDEMLEDKVQTRLDAAKMNVPDTNGNGKAETEDKKGLFGLPKPVLIAGISLIGLIVIGSAVLLLMEE